MIFIHEAQITLRQQQWLSEANFNDVARFMRSAPLRLLIIYVLQPGPPRHLERRFIPTIQGVRIGFEALGGTFSTPEEAQQAGEAFIACYPLDDIRPLPLDVHGLQLAAAPVEEFNVLPDLPELDLDVQMKDMAAYKLSLTTKASA